MPVPTDYKVSSPSANFETYPADIYQVQIFDIDLDKDYVSAFTGQKQDRFKFVYIILEDKYKGKKLVGYAFAKWFAGKGKESKLYTITRCAYAFYHPDVDISKLKAEEMLGSKVNELIGKQIRVNVDQTTKNDKVYNNITAYLPIKKELPAIQVTEQK